MRSSEASVARVENALLSTRVYARLRDDITSGRLAPGTRLVERRVASELSVSQGTVREAIKRLASEGLVLTAPHHGSSVATLDAAAARRAYRIRVALEQVAVDDFCATAIPTDFEALSGHIDAMRAAALVEDVEAVIRHDAGFHRLIWDGSGNPLLGRIWDLIEPSMRGLTRFSNCAYVTNIAEIADSHRPLLDALRSRNVRLAADMFADHAASVWNTIDARAAAHDPGLG